VNVGTAGAGFQKHVHRFARTAARRRLASTRALFFNASFSAASAPWLAARAAESLSIPQADPDPFIDIDVDLAAAGLDDF